MVPVVCYRHYDGKFLMTKEGDVLKLRENFYEEIIRLL